MHWLPSLSGASPRALWALHPAQTAPDLEEVPLKHPSARGKMILSRHRHQTKNVFQDMPRVMSQDISVDMT